MRNKVGFLLVNVNDYSNQIKLIIKKFETICKFNKNQKEVCVF